MSGSIIIALGFLLLVSFIINGALLAVSDHLKTFLPDVTVVFFNILNMIISFIVIAVLFGVIYKVLPDAKIRWRDVRSGALFTALANLIACVMITAYVRIGIIFEERKLVKVFGCAYKNYRKDTAMILPDIGSLRQRKIIR